MERRRRFRRMRRAFLGLASLGAVLAVYIACAPIAPPAARLAPAGTVVVAADGTVLQRDTQAGIRIPVSLDAVAPIVIEATIAAEDQRFWEHPGVDPLAMARAATHPGSRSGASTITQQVARRLYVGGPLAIRKPREWLVALQLEAHTTKRELLHAYLSDIPYGRGTYGIEAAAQVYFGQSAAKLDLAQATFLAGIPRYPGLDPDRDLATLKERQAYVLGRLLDDGRISAAERDDALVEPLHILPATAPPLAPRFVEFALDELQRVRPDLAGRPGLVIETTLDAGLQVEAERVAAVHLEAIEEQHAANAAVVVLDPRTGAVLVMAQHAKAGDPGSEVNLALALRQPGSALKPFLYAAALEGRQLTAASQLLDVETTFETPEGPYVPQNYDRRFNGPVTLRVALASSLNVPAARTLQAIGMDRFLGLAQRAGLTTLTDAERYGPAVVLGGGEVRLLDLARAYAMLADGGRTHEPFAVLRVRDGSGAVLYERAQPAPGRALSQEAAWLIGDILRDPVARELGFGDHSPLETPLAAAVKTGTTTGFRDNWTAGFTPERVVATWVGNADGSAMDGVTGVSGAAPIWRDVIKAASPNPPAWPPAPAGLVRARVCTPTGLRPGPACPSPTDEWFLAGTAPQAEERYYARDEAGALAIDPPPEARPWALDAGFRLVERPGAELQARVVQPVNGTVISLSPEIADERFLIRVSSADAAAQELRIDGALIGSYPGGDVSIPWPAVRGHHVIEVMAVHSDGRTATARTQYEVR